VAKVRELSTKVHHVVTITTFSLLSRGFRCPVALPPRPVFRWARRPASTTCAHTHATELLRAGMNGKIVVKRLGHAGVKKTLDRYSHVIPSLRTEGSRED